MFKGAFVAIVTPFKGKDVDVATLKRLVNFQLQQGIQGIVACGSTGESSMMTLEEQALVIKTVLDVVQRRVPVIAGVTAITPDAVLTQARQAEKLGVDGLMVAPPPYVKPTQQALYEHFKIIHDHTSTPMILYDVPGRCGVGIKDETVLALAQLEHIICMKDATGDLNRPVTLKAQLPQDFTLLTGEDAQTPAYLAQGGDGVISVTANVAPALVSAQCQSWFKGDLKTFGKVRDLLAPLHKAMFCESNPAPAKYGLSLYGLCSPEVRRPLTPLTSLGAQQVETAMSFAGLLTKTQAKNGQA